MLHRGNPPYGGMIVLKDFDEALVYSFTLDNTAPQTPQQVITLWKQLSEQFPNAVIKATSLDLFAEHLLQQKHILPVVTQEMGDTWLYGISADPYRLGTYREIARYMKENPTQFSDGYKRRLMKIPEHNWGLSVWTYSQVTDPMDYSHYWSNTEFQMHENDAFFSLLDYGWKEQRSYLFPIDGETWPVGLKERVMLLKPTKPTVSQWSSVNGREMVFEGKWFTIGVSEKDGSINRLVDKRSGKVWADQQHPLALYRYACSQPKTQQYE